MIEICTKCEEEHLLNGFCTKCDDNYLVMLLFANNNSKCDAIPFLFTKRRHLIEEIKSIDVVTKMLINNYATEEKEHTAAKKEDDEAKIAREREFERVQTLRKIGKEYKMENLAEYAIENNWTDDDLRKKILDRIKGASY